MPALCVETARWAVCRSARETFQRLDAIAPDVPYFAAGVARALFNSSGRMVMAEKKIVAVVGATGAQGGGLARAILSDAKSEFGVRALTREVNSEKAQALAKLGAEVVAADVDDVESLKMAFAGAYGAYCVTFFWAHFSPERETASAANLAMAA
jgi:hypothetical protein